MGFYSTGPKIRKPDLEIDELFRRYCPNPVLVICDVRPNVEGLPTTAYGSIEEVEEVRALVVLVTPVTVLHIAAYLQSTYCICDDATNRMARRSSAFSSTSSRRSARTKPKRSAWSTCFAISTTLQ